MLNLILALTVLASQQPAILQPETYTSPSGEWRFSVDPTSKFGTGEASVTMTHGSTTAWEAKVPFTFWEAAVTDAGYTAGYAFTGRRDSVVGAGEFIVAIFGPDGSAVLEERVARTGSRFPHSRANPNPLGLFIHPALERLVVRVADPDLNAQDETWWSYRIATGEPLGRVPVKRKLEDAEPLRQSMEARALEGTRLTLVQWYHFRWGSPARRELGTRFVLVDEDWRPVWELGLEKDFRHSDQKTEDRRLDALSKQSGILAVGPHMRFELRHVAQEERVTYEVEADPVAPRGWSVREISRSPTRVATPERVAMTVGHDRLELKALESVPLDWTRRPVTPFHDIVCFDFDAAGNIRLVRREEDGSVTFVHLDDQGSVAREVHVGPLTQGSEGAHMWSVLQPDRWLHCTRSYGEDGRTRAWVVEGANGEAREVEGLSKLTIEAVASAPDGSFVVLGTYNTKHTSSSELLALGPVGQRRWSVRQHHDPKAEAGLFSPKDVAIDIDGSVLVLDHVRRWVQVFTSKGEFVHKVDLEKLWEEQSLYLTELLVEPSGNWLLHDFHEPSAWLRVDREGQLVTRITPRRENGSREVGLSSAARVDPVGRLWITDGDELAICDENGVARTRFGAAPDPNELGRPERVYFDGRGRIALVDERSHAVHLFAPTGARELVLVPDATDFDAPMADVQGVRSTAAGDVYVQASFGEDDYLRFSPTGERLGRLQLGGDDVAFLANGERWVANGSPYDDSFVQKRAPDGSGGAMVTRRPDNHFFEWIRAVDCTPDGDLAVLAGSASELGLDLFDSRGAPLRTITLSGAPMSSVGQLCLGRSWAVISDGSNEALLVSLDDGQIFAVRVAMGAERTLHAFEFSRDGRELWCATLEPPALHRLALPK